jgi:hypothetical protein
MRRMRRRRKRKWKRGRGKRRRTHSRSQPPRNGNEALNWLKGRHRAVSPNAKRC